MYPSFSLHRLATSRLLRVMAVLVWLLTTVSVLAAPPSAMANIVQGNGVASAMPMEHAMHAGDHHAGHCCGGTAHPACHCEAMCGTAMLPPVPILHGPVRLAAMRLPMRSIDAPTPVPTPPLRPPAI
jgi:hypothetical protein